MADAVGAKRKTTHGNTLVNGARTHANRNGNGNASKRARRNNKKAENATAKAKANATAKRNHEKWVANSEKAYRLYQASQLPIPPNKGIVVSPNILQKWHDTFTNGGEIHPTTPAFYKALRNRKAAIAERARAMAERARASAGAGAGGAGGAGT